MPALKAASNPALRLYAQRCRNKDKRAYALAYADYLEGFTTTEPPRPEGLSFMGAQAVRLHMGDLVR